MKMTLKEINEEIRNYPTPIVGCDTHFNCLLEERRRLQTLINKMKTKKKKLDDDSRH
ncbi:MAG: hypothetical protein CFH06_00738 [Alphaproteobacteria bacterium MarineAlpha3_Bin5]|nr:MAG: hypothetical protein CFH06_00738 [Alphaproteobacteria bacterium MarineAlpha3_Bin5]|tara:strand:- start:537 stop:707 length:171 start_codon:yes stop_codon:yes gene_type:complete